MPAGQKLDNSASSAHPGYAMVKEVVRRIGWDVTQLSSRVALGNRTFRRHLGQEGCAPVLASVKRVIDVLDSTGLVSADDLARLAGHYGLVYGPPQLAGLRLLISSPFVSNFFVERPELRPSLRRPGPGSPTRMHAFVGDGGTGKTQAAAQWFQAHANEYHIAAWLNGESLESELLALADRMNIAVETQSSSERLRALRDHLSVTPEVWLFVIDGLRSADDLQLAVPSQGGCALVTTQDRAISALCPSTALGEFTDAQVRDLFAVAVPNASAAEIHAAVEAVGNLPLAIHQIATYCAASGTDISTAAARANDLMSDPPVVASLYPRPVDRAWLAGYQAALQVEGGVADLMAAVSVLNGQRLPLDLLEAAVGSQIELAVSIELLDRFSVVRRWDGMLQVHDRVQRSARSVLPRPAIENALSHVANAVERMIGERDDATDPSIWPVWRHIAPHVEAMGMSLQQGMSSPIVERVLGLLIDLVDALYWQGSIDAVRVGRLAVERSESMLGLDDPVTLSAMNNLSCALWRAGQSFDGVALITDVVERRTRTLGEDHDDTLIAMNNLAVDCEALGDFERAASIHERCAQIRLHKYGELHFDTWVSFNNLANAVLKVGDAARALEIHRHLEETRPRIEGAEVFALTNVQNIGKALRSNGDLQLARTYLERAVQIAAVSSGEDHRDTYRAQYELGLLESDEGNLRRARQLLERAANGRRSALGPEHPDTIATMSILRQVDARIRGRPGQ